MAEDDPALSEPLITSSREGAEGPPVSKLNGVVEDADAEFGVAAALAVRLRAGQLTLATGHARSGGGVVPDAPRGLCVWIA